MISKFIKNINKQDYILNENFRSDPKVIKFINNLFSNEFMYYDEPIEFDKESPLVTNEDKKSEENPVNIFYQTDIVEIIKNLVSSKSIQGKNINYGDIAILCRKNYMVDIVGEKCKEAGIPVEVIGGHGFYKSKEILDVYRFFNYIIYKRTEYRNELF